MGYVSLRLCKLDVHRYNARGQASVDVAFVAGCPTNLSERTGGNQKEIAGRTRAAFALHGHTRRWGK
jgi:hypothetical protein